MYYFTVFFRISHALHFQEVKKNYPFSAGWPIHRPPLLLHVVPLADPQEFFNIVIYTNFSLENDPISKRISSTF
jgi:hypothetical protein